MTLHLPLSKILYKLTWILAPRINNNHISFVVSGGKSRILYFSTSKNANKYKKASF